MRRLLVPLGCRAFLLVLVVPPAPVHAFGILQAAKIRGGLSHPIQSDGPSLSALPMQQQPSSSSSSSSSASASAGAGGVVSVDPDTKRIHFMRLSKDQDDELTRLGEHEQLLMKTVVPVVPTKTATATKSSSKRTKNKRTPRKSGAGFGGGGGGGGGGLGSGNQERDKGAANRREGGMDDVQALASVLERDGLVCLESVLPDDITNSLRDYLIDLRDRSRADIEAGIITNSHERFADVLLNQNRCDLKVPLGPAPVHDALRHLLSSSTVLRDLIEVTYARHGCVGSHATLYELNCFMSQSGARRQLVHADIVCQSDDDRPTLLGPDEPIMLTCFVALQDVDETMGPTYFIPGTHNWEAHEQFFETNNNGPRTSSTKDRLLSSRPAVMGTLKKGSCILFDPRTLHCAGANVCSDPAKTRALFYFSFKNPKVDSPGCPSCGGYGIPDAEFTLQRLCEELQAEASGAGIGAAAYRKLAMIASNP